MIAPRGLLSRDALLGTDLDDVLEGVDSWPVEACEDDHRHEPY